MNLFEKWEEMPIPVIILLIFWEKVGKMIEKWCNERERERVMCCQNTKNKIIIIK